MRRQSVFQKDTVAAATELGYILTFLLGLSFLSMFSVWTWGLQDARGDVWLEQAMEENLDSVAAAVERADFASRLDANVTYAEPVDLLLSTAVNLKLRMVLSDDGLLMQDQGGFLVTRRDISATGPTIHTGEVELAGIERVWVVLEGNTITLSSSQPGL
jgi:hypothetical protein